MNYILEVEQNNFYGSTDLCVSFPAELTDELNWNLGDIIEWDIKGKGIILTKLRCTQSKELSLVEYL